MVAGIIEIVAAAVLAYYCYVTWRNRNSGFSNTYVWTANTKRDRCEIEKEYRLLTRIFGGLATVFLLFGMGLLVKNDMLRAIGEGILMVLLVFTVRDAIRLAVKK